MLPSSSRPSGKGLAAGSDSDLDPPTAAKQCTSKGLTIDASQCQKFDMDSRYEQNQPGGAALGHLTADCSDPAGAAHDGLAAATLGGKNDTRNNGRRAGHAVRFASDAVDLAAEQNKHWSGLDTLQHAPSPTSSGEPADHGDDAASVEPTANQGATSADIRRAGSGFMAATQLAYAAKQGAKDTQIGRAAEALLPLPKYIGGATLGLDPDFAAYLRNRHRRGFSIKGKTATEGPAAPSGLAACKAGDRLATKQATAKVTGKSLSPHQCTAPADEG